jgi:ABC-type glycerol-3-phosphate transport system substrate-binding protein
MYFATDEENEMKKKALVWVVGLCLMAAEVFASGAQSAAQAPAAGGQPQVALSMVNRVNVDVQIDNNPIFPYIKEKTGFAIELEAPPINNYTDRLQIIMASGDLPDLIYIQSLDQSYIRWAEDGLLLPVDDLVKKYPNIMHNVTPEMFELVQIPSTGLAYVVPRPNKVNRWGMIINKQWLAKLGVKAPTTIDEFYEYGKLVATKDPDGNGQNDTYLYSPPSGSVFQTGAIMDAFLPSSGQVPDFDGVYKIREKMNGYYPYLEFMRKLYAEKILDPEYFLNKVYDDRDKTLQGRVALFVGHDTNVTENPLLNNNGALDKFDFVPPIKAADGKSRNYVGAPVWGGWAISATSKHVEDALRYLDWGNSPDGYETLFFGMKGQTYNSYNLRERKVDQTDAQRNLWQRISSSYMTVAFAYEGKGPSVSTLPAVTDWYNKNLESYLANVVEISVPTIKLPELDVFNANNPDLITRKTELENKYIIGEISQDELKAFINNEWIPRYAVVETAYLKAVAARK